MIEVVARGGGLLVESEEEVISAVVVVVVVLHLSPHSRRGEETEEMFIAPSP